MCYKSSIMSTVCQACGFNNPPGMRFCGNCGTRLTDAAVPASTAIPTKPNLGVMMGADLIERFRQAGLQAAGQRRNVTVLFADLTDYTGLSEQIDSEDLYEIIQRFINMLVAAVYRYDGMVDKIVGDGLMALFGAPIGHENNAELALRAALDMQAGLEALNRELRPQLGQDLQMHIGLHSGTVIVGSVGSNMLMDYTAIGDTVNLAHRLEEVAEPGTVLASESVYRQTRMLFDFTAVPALTLKGIHRPVTGYRLLGPKDRPGRVRGVEGLVSPMVGRDAELERLKTAVLRGAGETGGFAMIFGEAGIGKSRLLAELRLQLRDENIRIAEGQSLTYRRSVAYWIFLDLLRDYLGVSDNAPEAHVRARLAETVEAVAGDQAADLLPYLEHLLSLKPSNARAAARLRQLDADQLRRQIFIAVRDLFVAESARQPVLLVLDDLHWADDASLDLLDFLLNSVDSAPLFICGISRPVEGGSLPRIVEQARSRLRDRFLLIELTSLPQEKSEQLLNQLLTIPDFPAEMRAQIIQRAAGVPFYLEEILRMLIDEAVIYREGDRWRLYPEADVASLGVPDNLQALILARFDRLDRQQRRILQVASVIGREFSVALVEAVLSGLSGTWIDTQLVQLSERGFIVPQDGSLQADYAFRHVLTSDAIYSTLLRRDRAELHGQVGAAIETLYADRLGEYTYLLARHYSWSNRPDRALHYLILAGQKSARDYVNAQARDYFEQALELLDKVEATDEQAFDVRAGLGDALVFDGEYENARQHYRAAQELIAPDTPERTRLYVNLQRKIGLTYERQGDYEQALAFYHRAHEALDACRTEMPVERAEVWNDIGWIYFRRGDFDDAAEIFQRALDLVSGTDAYGVIASINNRLGGVAYFQGDWDRAAEHLRNSIATREAIGDVAGLASSSNNLGNLEIEMGRFDEALADLERNLALVQQLGQVEGIAVAYNNLGWLHTLRGETAQAEALLQKSLDLSLQIGFNSLIREVRRNIGELYQAMGRWDEAREAFLEILPEFESAGASSELLNIYRLLGETAVARDDLAEAQVWAQKLDAAAESLASEQTSIPALQRGELLRFRGMVAAQKQNWEQAEGDLRRSVDEFRKLNSRLNEGRSLYQLGRLFARQGRSEAAAGYFAEAAQIFNEIGARLDAQRARAALDALPSDRG